MKTRKSRIQALLAVLVAALAISGAYLFLHRGEVSTDDAAIDGRNIVISAKVPGYVRTLNITDNQPVKTGDVLLEIDPADYIIRRDRAKASLDAAKAQTVSAQAALEKARSDLARMQRLSRAARSQEQLEQAQSAFKAAQAENDQLDALVRQAEAELAQAEKDVSDTKIIAPADGTIAKRSVESGNYVQAGQQLASLVGSELWVVANLKETQLKDVRTGDAVDIRVDAYPGLALKGKVDSIQRGTGSYFSAFPPENATGNYVKIIQRVPVKIVFNELPDTHMHLGLGMSVVPVIHAGSAQAAAQEQARADAHDQPR